MKILSVTIIPPDEDAQWWRIINIAKRLRSHESEVDIVHYISKGFDAHKSLDSKTDENTNSSSITIASPLLIPFKHLWNVYRNKYDIIYGNTFGGAFFSILGKLTGIPLILDMHGISDEFSVMENKPNKYKMRLIKLMEFLSLRFSDRIICVSRNMIDYLHNEKDIPYAKMIYATNGVDLNFFKPCGIKEVESLKQSLGIKNKFVFGYIGGFQGYQGVENLIIAAKNMKNDNVKFLIIGGNKNYIEDGIIFISRVPREQIPNYYSICDVLVLPRPKHIATEVAAPTKFAEYTSMGKPILTTNVGDAAYLVKKYDNGIVVEDNSIEVLKKGINTFLTIDENKLVTMGKKSRNLAECEFDWNLISQKIDLSCRGVLNE